MITIQPFSVAFHQAVVALILNIQQAEFGLSITLNDQPDLIDIPGYFEQFWIALDDGHVVGTIGLIRIENYGVIRKMFVHKEFRGSEKSIAQQLLKTLENYSATHGITHLYLGTTTQFHAAHRFYEKNSYYQISAHELPATFPKMGIDSIFYTKELALMNICS